MRNAEKFVAQGKIRSAISEYREVVDNDPRDIATLNMLGDLFAKSAEKREAVDCYLKVAEHYNTQGFSQKAIAIYNKISRIQPESIEVSAKLAELHKIKGSLSEARSHYTTLAEHYQKNGRRLEALSIYKQIALLDPNNTEVCLSLAESYLREGQRDDALESYTEAGARFSRQGNHEEAIRALMKGFDIQSTDLRILNGLVKAQTALGRAGKAASLLEEIIENEPYNRDVLYLLIECCIDAQNADGAEKAVIKLVEIEPANYPKFLDLIRIYLNVNDPESAARILTMSSEYLLAGGQADECGKWINEILGRDPSQLSALRLLVRYNSWLKDENGFRLALERIYGAAAAKNSIEDERFALAQLVVIRPHETQFRERLNEINTQYGYDDIDADAELLKAQFAADNPPLPEPAPELPSIETIEPAPIALYFEGVEQNGHSETDPVIGEAVGLESFSRSEEFENGNSKLSHTGEQRLQKELESITFYIENDYHELAEKALIELATEFGSRQEIEVLQKRIGMDFAAAIPVEAIVESVPVPAEIVDTSPILYENAASRLGIDEIRSEFGIEGHDDATDEDYETRYNTAIAYKEMGLTEEAIREFQEAVNLTTPNDETRRFFHCANLLGHCFLESGKANHAITWIKRALATPNISDEEFHGLWYELALAYQASGDEEESAKYFERIYAEDVDFRDVSNRVKNLVVNHL